MLVLAAAVVAAALAGLVRRWSSGPTPDSIARPFSPAMIAVMIAGGAAAGAGDHIAGRAGLALLDTGLVLIAVGAAGAARFRAGFVLIAAGVAANFAVIAANGGMPVLGLTAAAPAAGHHLGASSQDHLLALADGIQISGEVLSPGDVAVAAGAALAIFAAVPRRRNGSRPGPYRAPAHP